jgi:hypothetical protein
MNRVKKYFAAKFKRRLRLGLRALRYAHDKKNDMWESTRILVQISEVPVNVLPNRWLYGRENSLDALDARARTVIYKFSLNFEIHNKIRIALYDSTQLIFTQAPGMWRHKLKEYGFIVPSFINQVRWALRQLKFLFSSLRTTLRMSRYSWDNVNFQPSPPYWIADRFLVNCLPSTDEKISEYRLVPHLAKILAKDGLKGELWAPAYGNPKTFSKKYGYSSPQIFPPLKTRLKTLKFFFISIFAVGLCGVKWLSGCSGAPALSEDVVMLRYFLQLSDRQLPNWYVVTHSGCGARPLWVREAEARGVKTAMVFYSINNRAAQFNHAKLEVSENPEHLFLNWSRYIVPDPYQAKWLRSLVREEAKYIELDFMPYVDNGDSIPEVPENTLSVFDITPVPDNWYVLLGERSGVSRDRFVSLFWTDISEVSEKLGISLLIKSKRSRPPKWVGPKYRRIMDNLKDSPNCIVVDSGVAAMRVIKKTQASISFPFTTTAIDTANLGKQSVYYDPSGIIQTDRYENHGIEVIRGKDKLEEWMLSLDQPASSPVKNL